MGFARVGTSWECSISIKLKCFVGVVGAVDLAESRLTAVIQAFIRSTQKSIQANRHAVYSLDTR